MYIHIYAYGYSERVASAIRIMCGTTINCAIAVSVEAIPFAVLTLAIALVVFARAPQLLSSCPLLSLLTPLSKACLQT